MLRIEGLDVERSSIPVLNDVSISVEGGEIACIIGSNGAGKSTLLWTIAGLLRPTRGTITFKDEDITSLPPYLRVERGLALTPEGRGLFGGLTVEENLASGAYRKSARESYEKTLERIFELFPSLRERRKQPAFSLSGGEQQMLAVSRALMSQPDMLLLDEPSLGLAPITITKLYDAIRRISEEGITVLIVEQYVQHVLRLADKGYILENGRIIHEDSADVLLSSSLVKSAYLGT